jgi:hypothetical protein
VNNGVEGEQVGGPVQSGGAAGMSDGPTSAPMQGVADTTSAQPTEGMTES